MSQRPGFNILNYGDLAPSGAGASPDLAEPDSGDFSLLGNHRSGVVRGCEISFAGDVLSVTSETNVVLRNGAVESFSSTTASATITGTGPKFTLVSWDGTGLVTVDGAVDPDNPVFPALSSDHVVLAAVYTDDTGSRVHVDKRVLLANGLFGQVDSGSNFIQHGTSEVTFSVTGSGQIRFGTGVSAPQISSDGTSIVLSTALAAPSATLSGGLTSGGAGAFTGTVTGSNLLTGSAYPTVSAAPGTLYQRNDGDGNGFLYLRTALGWQEAVPDVNPVGTVISNIAGPANAGLLAQGWLPLDGRSLVAADVQYPGLWAVAPASWKVNDHDLLLPSTNNRVLSGAGATSTGSLGPSGRSTNTLTLTAGQMPPHQHRAGETTTGPAGGHGHTVNGGGGVTGGGHGHTISSGGGTHGHTVSDPGHRHNGVDSSLGSAFIYTAWGGRNKLDGYFNDSSHTYSVEPAEYTKAATTGVTINSSTGAHGHTVSGAGDHSHSVVVDAVPAHSHTFPADTVVGAGEAVDFSPLHMAVYFYVKAG